MGEDRGSDVVELDESGLPRRGGVERARPEPLTCGEHHPQTGVPSGVREADDHDVRAVGSSRDDLSDPPVDGRELLIVGKDRLVRVGDVDVAWVTNGANVDQRGGAGGETHGQVGGVKAPEARHDAVFGRRRGQGCPGPDRGEALAVARQNL